MPTLRKTRLDRFQGMFERLGDFLGVLAAGLGQVGAAAAAAAHDGGHLLEPVAGVQALLDQVRDRPATS